MTSPALTKTRIALGLLMATATLATTGVAGALALAHSQTTARDAGEAVAAGTDHDDSPSHSTKRRPTNTTGSFAPTSKATSAPTVQSHTKTKGS